MPELPHVVVREPRRHALLRRARRLEVVPLERAVERDAVVDLQVDVDRPRDLPGLQHGRHAPVPRAVRLEEVRLEVLAPDQRALDEMRGGLAHAGLVVPVDARVLDRHRAEARLDHLHADAPVEERLLWERHRDGGEAALLVLLLQRLARGLDVVQVALRAEVGLEQLLDLARGDQGGPDDLVGLDRELGPVPHARRQLDVLLHLDLGDEDVLGAQRAVRVERRPVLERIGPVGSGGKRRQRRERAGERQPSDAQAEGGHARAP